MKRLFPFLMGVCIVVAAQGQIVPPPVRPPVSTPATALPPAPPKVSSPDPLNTVAVFESPNFQGKTKTYGVGKYRLFSAADLNDMISSIRVGAGVTVIITEHANTSGNTHFGHGLRYNLMESVPDLSKINLNDKISFIEVVAKRNPSAINTRAGYEWVEGQWKTINGQKSWVPGHWQRARASELIVVAPPVKVPSTAKRKYESVASFRKINFITLGDLKSNQSRSTFLREDIKENGQHIYYADKLTLENVVLQQNCDHVLVVDTLIIPKNGGRLTAACTGTLTTSSSTTTPQYKKTFLKIIANHITRIDKPAEVYLNNYSIANNNNNGEFFYTTRTISISEQSTAMASNTLFSRPGFGTSHPFSVYSDGYSYEEGRLFNQWVIFALSDLRTALNLLSSKVDQKWQMDRLYQRFLHVKSLFDPKIEEGKDAFNQHVEEIEAFCKSAKIEIRYLPLTAATTVPILVSKNEQNLFNYTVLPDFAQVLPLHTDEKKRIGTIQFNATGDPNYNLEFTLSLKHNKQHFQQAKSILFEKYGLSLDSILPSQLNLLKPQVFKLKGKTFNGELIPISNNLAKVEALLPREAKTLIDLFPSNQSNKLSLDFSVDGEVLPKELALVLPDSLSKALVQSAYSLENFDVLMLSDPFVDHLKLISGFSPTYLIDNTLVPLDFIELSVDFRFGDLIHKKGPFRFSFQNSIASEQLIHFVKIRPQCDIVVSGVASYGNGNFLFTIDNILVEQQILQVHEGYFKY
jgi:hypothetical protein